MEATTTRIELADDVQDDGRSLPEPNSSCSRRCIQKLLTNVSFSLSLFSGLSLTMSGLFKEEIGSEELDAGRVQYRSKRVALLGSLIVFYSAVGFFLSCSKRIYERYKLLCPINFTISFGTFIYSLLSEGFESEIESKTLDVKHEDPNTLARS